MHDAHQRNLMTHTINEICKSLDLARTPRETRASAKQYADKFKQDVILNNQSLIKSLVGDGGLESSTMSDNAEYLLNFSGDLIVKTLNGFGVIGDRSQGSVYFHIESTMQTPCGRLVGIEAEIVLNEYETSLEKWALAVDGKDASDFLTVPDRAASFSDFILDTYLVFNEYDEKYIKPSDSDLAGIAKILGIA